MTTSFPVTKAGPRFRLDLGLAAAGCLAMLLLAGPASADDKVLAKVNGEEIHQSDVAFAEEQLGPKLAQMDPATKDENILQYLIQMKIILKGAQDEKVADSDTFKKHLDFLRNQLLMQTVLDEKAKAAATDDAIKSFYDDAVKQIAGEQEVHARHILVDTEAKAKEIKAELDKGANFEELAKKESKDPGASDGGDLGFFTKDQMVPEFSAVAFSLQPGQISDPVKSQFGWHIIKVEEKRNRKPPSLDEVKDQVVAALGQKADAEYFAKLKATAKVERFDQAANAPAGGAPADAAKAADGKAPDAKAPDAAAKDSKMAPAKK